MLNNVGFAMAVEKLLGIDEQIPERAQYIRVIVGEISRITDHLTCLGASAMELGAFTAFLYALKAREWLCELLEEVSRRAPDATATCRIGGVVVRPARRASTTSCATSSTRHAGRDGRRRASCCTATASSATAWTASASSPRRTRLAYGITGPWPRATGLAYDVRKDHPYLVYDRFDFDVPVGSVGDNFDRFAVRVEEMHQSMRILDQALAQIPAGPGAWSTTRASCCRPRARSTTSIEAMIAHFKLIMDGIHVPRRRGLLVHRGRQRRARLLHRVRRHRPPVEVPRAPALLRQRPRS